MTDITRQLADALEGVLASAHPNSVEHPTMYAAWQKGIMALTAYRESLKGEETCPECGQPWEQHEFGVPKPYCPDIRKEQQ
jgi:hypothetical protein